MADKSSLLFFLLFSLHLILIAASVNVHGADLEEENVWAVKKEDRKSIVSTEDGEISSAWITRGCRSYHLQFITLEPNSLFLPVLLHEDMVFYVHTGSGRLSWTDENHSKYADLRRGDVYRMPQGTVFFLQSSLETERPKLRIHAIFVGSDDDFSEQATRVYSSIRDMVLGFDKKVLQAAFKVPEEVIEKILNGTKPPAIVHGVPRTKRTAWEMEAQFMRGLIGTRGYNIFELNKKKQKTTKLFNIFSEDKDFENCNGWSTTVTRKRLSALKGSDGSMMGPHWNPRATEIAVVLQGQGMIRVVCSGISNETDCRNTRLKVEEGDVFAIPRFHPMAQMAFNNDTFVFMGFSTSTKKNYPQFLAGKASVLQTLDKGVLSVSFNIENTTVDRLLAPQHDSVILGCTSCAEEELRMMEEEMEKEKEAERKREEEEARKKAEEKRREEEEARKREEEEARKEEEERRKREEEEEEAKRREEEEAKRKAEEEEAKRREREQEEARKREEEEEAKRREREQEEARKREEEEARKEEEERRKREEEEAEAKRREEEEEEAKRREREQEEARQREQEEARRRQEEEEEAKKREQEQAEKEEEEEEAQRREEEEARKRQEETRKRQEEAEAQREEEEARKRQEEEEAQRREEEEAKRRQEEQEGQQPGRSEEEQAAERERKQQEEAQREEEAARQQEKEMERQQQQEGGGKGEGQQVHMDEE
ncbi:Nucleic acid binding protein [Forsythia ovata]|uniref:Nucleic acid binding protein n=1 Tax=Forsythia ovata TaxID=205694 RepID=A0ABD1U7Y0_9LAMI